MSLPLRSLTRAARLLAIPFLLAPLSSGCSPERYRRSADRQVYGIVAEKQEVATGRKEPFELRQAKVSLEEIGAQGEVQDLKRTPPPQPVVEPLDLEAPPAAPAQPEVAPPAAPPARPEAAPPAAPPAKAEAAQATPPAPTVPARILTLADVLRAAFANSREYQSQKEEVYLTALALTLARWVFAPRFFGLVSGDYVWDSEGEQQGSISTDFGWNQLLASGARLSISVANNFLRFFTGEQREVANTIISGAITQPLLRGFGREVTLDPLVQAERDVIYQIRAFERFRQTFAVQVASEFYRALEARNRVSNEYLNWQGLVNNRGRAEALEEGGRLPRFEVDQVLQQELQARNRYAVAVEDYQSALDRLKVTLAFPIDALISLDQNELPRLEESGRAPVDVEVEVEVAEAVAVRLRLDLRTAFDRTEDAARRIRVAANALKAQLDVNLSATLPSSSQSQPLKFNSQDLSYAAGLDLNLPFDRRAERNAYAAALVAEEAAQRAADLLEDVIRLNVREAHRRLLLERETMGIQEASVRLAQARVESTNALRDAGRAETRDVLDSQSALIDAQNAFTSALINLAIARLDFYSDTGALRVLEDGQWTLEPLVEPVQNG